jgi:DNA-binding IclR family transcriptional regulator
MVRNKVVYTELMNHNIMLDNIEKGSGIPAYPSGIGKCLIASLSGDELDEMLYSYPLVKYTDHTITDVAEYRKHLRNVRTQGWAVNDEETIIGMRFVAAPVFDFRGSAIAGISVSGSLDDINDDNLEQIANTVMNTAAVISRRMGYLP